MKPYLAVVASSNGTVTKYQDFNTLQEAQDHAQEYGGFAATTPNGPTEFWVVNGNAVTLDAAARNASDLRRQWDIDMAEASKTMSDELEGHIEQAHSGTVGGAQQVAYDNKKQVRSRKP